MHRAYGRWTDRALQGSSLETACTESHFHPYTAGATLEYARVVEDDPNLFELNAHKDPYVGARAVSTTHPTPAGHLGVNCEAQ
jgi:hypothetical protein